MLLPEDTHTIRLRFKIDSDAPQEYINKWLKFKSICESGKNKKVVTDWLQNCKIESIKNMPYLPRCEGGIGGGDNIKNKQIRFRQLKLHYHDNDILFDSIISSENEKWTLDELDDLNQGFRRTANNYVKANCINGCIEMINRNYNDDY